MASSSGRSSWWLSCGRRRWPSRSSSSCWIGSWIRQRAGLLAERAGSAGQLVFGSGDAWLQGSESRPQLGRAPAPLAGLDQQLQQLDHQGVLVMECMTHTLS